MRLYPAITTNSAVHLSHPTDLTSGTSPFLPDSAPRYFQHCLHFHRKSLLLPSYCIASTISAHPIGCSCLPGMPTAVLLIVPTDTYTSPSAPSRSEHLSRERETPDSQLLQGLAYGGCLVALRGTGDTWAPVSPCPPGTPGDNRHKTSGDAT